MMWIMLFLNVVFVLYIYDSKENSDTEGEVKGVSSPEKETVYVKEPSPILISATHLGDIDGYEKVYDVPDTDRSYYINKHYKYSLIDLGTEVAITTSQGIIRGRVVESIEGSFKVSVDDPSLIFNGMSGSRVVWKGEEIGFVSELTDSLEVLCYTLN